MRDKKLEQLKETYSRMDEIEQEDMFWVPMLEKLEPLRPAGFNFELRTTSAGQIVAVWHRGWANLVLQLPEGKIKDMELSDITAQVISTIADDAERWGKK